MASLVSSAAAASAGRAKRLPSPGPLSGTDSPFFRQ
jgi:hypothetical protein